MRLALLVLTLVLACGLPAGQGIGDGSSGLGEIPDAGCEVHCVEAPPPLLDDGGFDPDGGFSIVCACG